MSRPVNRPLRRLLRASLLAFRPTLGVRVVAGLCSAGLIAVAAVVVSNRVTDHLEQSATAEASRTISGVVRAYVDPLLAGIDVAEFPPRDATAINTQLEALVASGDILRIKIWAPDGTVLYSDLAALRGRQFEIEGDLGDALAGTASSEFGPAGAAENEFEHDLAPVLLSAYLPIRAGTDRVVAAYEIYQDGRPLQAEIDATRGDVILIVGAMAMGLFALLWAASSGTARLLGLQNRLLRQRAEGERLLSLDLRRSEERFRSLVQSSADGVLVIRADDHVGYESPAVEGMLGMPPDSRLGRAADSLVHPDDAARWRDLLADVRGAPGRRRSGEVRARHHDGTWRTLEATATNLLEDPAVAGIVVNYRDVTERRRLELELRHQAFHDSLTGLANRALFGDRLAHALERSRRSGDAVAVLFLDLDDFKTVNDSLGHAEGDLLLTAVAHRFGGALRPSDTIARMGGDEFAVLLEDVEGEDAVRDVATRLLAALDRAFGLAGRELVVRATMGAAMSEGGRTPARDLLRNADAALYSGKRHGKGRLEFFHPEMHKAAVERLALGADLEKALRRGELFLEYQPIVDLATGRVVGLESLVRWDHPERGVVAPRDFIGIAEETGLIVDIGRWILGEATTRAAEWVRDSPWIFVSINVSARQLRDPDFPDDVVSALAGADLDPARLVLEFTETIVMEDTERTLATLAALKTLGVRLAIDDFGTGFSSLSYLHMFPFDILKIDGSFVQQAADETSGEPSALLRAIVELGRTLGLEMIAEGIEDEAQLDRLRALGAHCGQGYLFSPPRAATWFAARSHRRDSNSRASTDAADAGSDAAREPSRWRIA